MPKVDGDRTRIEWATHDEWGPWPTPRQELLLRASLLSAPEALDAWAEWKQDTEIDRVPMPSMSLLPLLYHNLLANGAVDPMMAELKKRYAATWYSNQILLRRMAECVSHLEAKGIGAVVLKGAAMTLVYYRDHGVRPMGDVDLLVKPEDSMRAIDVLRECGFESTTSLSAEARRYMHGAHFVDGSGLSVDLHWRLIWEIDTLELDLDIWDSSAALGNLAARVLDPTHQLFHVLVHGARWNSAPLRWVADALTITNTRSDEVDFERIATIAGALGLHLPVRQTLRYLRDRWSVQVPKTVLASLEAIPTSRIERAEHRYLARNREYLLLGNLPMHIFHFMRFTGGMSPLPRLAELLRFLAFAWGLGRVRRLPLAILSKTASRVRTAFLRFEL